MMKKFFKMCKQKKKPVVILTLNGRAKTESGKLAFKKALSYVGVQDVEVIFTDKIKVNYINKHY